MVRNACWRLLGPLACVVVLGVGAVAAQPHSPVAKGSGLASAPPAPAVDALGRQTPRGTVLGFLGSARRGEWELARQYLDTHVGQSRGQALAQELFGVLDAKLPPRLTEISDEPLGSRANPLAAHLEVVGTIAGETGTIDIVVERIERGGRDPIWLFSSATLAAIPALHDEVARGRAAGAWPRFLSRSGVGGLRSLEWLVLLAGIALFFAATALLNRVLVVLVRPLWRRFAADPARVITNVLPMPARLLLLAIVSYWLLPEAPLSLRVRQFWSSAAGALAIVSVVSLLILLNAEIERVLNRRTGRGETAAFSALLRVLRRVADAVYIVVGLIVMLRQFGVDPTPALAGLGVGGLAVALAAQKTLENVIAGASLIVDKAVTVGDFLKVGETEGTVDHIGLRSTRLRTLDRTIVSIPNSQIANATLERVSARDKFWFHPEVRLRHDTTPAQLRAVIDECRRLLSSHPDVEPDDQRVRLHRLGPFSFDIEIFAYVRARNWTEFLQVQEQLLFGVATAVEASGAALAVPWQTAPTGVQGTHGSLTMSGSSR